MNTLVTREHRVRRVFLVSFIAIALYMLLVTGIVAHAVNKTIEYVILPPNTHLKDADVQN